MRSEGKLSRSTSTERETVLYTNNQKQLNNLFHLSLTFYVNICLCLYLTSCSLSVFTLCLTLWRVRERFYVILSFVSKYFEHFRLNISLWSFFLLCMFQQSTNTPGSCEKPLHINELNMVFFVKPIENCSYLRIHWKFVYRAFISTAPAWKSPSSLPSPIPLYDVYLYVMWDIWQWYTQAVGIHNLDWIFHFALLTKIVSYANCLLSLRSSSFEIINGAGQMRRVTERE